MLIAPAPNGRRHGLRARLSRQARPARIVLIYREQSQVFLWSTDRRAKPALVKA